MPAFILDTELESTYIKQLSVFDAEAYFEAVDANREHLSQFGDPTAEKYPTLESVRRSIIDPTDPDKIRMGIWHKTQFVGSINLTPIDKGTASDEIGYWLDSRYTGHGYATAAVRTLAKFATENGTRNLIANVDPGNIDSQNVLKRAGFTQIAQYQGNIIFRLIGGIK